MSWVTTEKNVNYRQKLQRPAPQHNLLPPTLRAATMNGLYCLGGQPHNIVRNVIDLYVEQQPHISVKHKLDEFLQRGHR